MDAVKLFYSYSQQDEGYRDELEKSLSMLKRYDDLQEWHFRKISPGKDFDNEINKELESSDIILLLVSRDFLASDYCYDIEVKKAMELNESGSAVVIPVILRECDWTHSKSPFKHLEGLPKNAKPISQWTDIDTAFNDVTQRLKETINAIKSQKKKINNDRLAVTDVQSATISDEDNFDTLGKAFKLINQEITRLDYNSSKEDFEEVQKLRGKLYEELIGKLDDKIENIPSLRSNVVNTLFEKIYTSGKIDSITIRDTQNIRNKKSIYLWYERKIIINALTLSLLNSTVFDPSKVNILIDFLTDFEENVWEGALIGIVITLIHHQNKWSRFNDLKIRLQTLQEISRVQAGLRQIELIFRFKLYSKNVFNEKMYQLPFFSSPLNCFLPFYSGNPILERAIQNNNSSIDSDYFINYVTELPFLDCHKYSLCLGLESNTIRAKKLKRKDVAIFRENLYISSNFDPYQNLISEYFNFFKYFPQSSISNIFTNHFSITKTKLKGLILNKINESVLSADILMDDKEYREAINLLYRLLEIEPNNIDANSKIAICFVNLKKPDYYSALEHLNRLEKINKDNLQALIGIAQCNIALKNYPTAYTYILKAKEKNQLNKQTLLLQCDYYEHLRDYPQVIEICQIGIEKYKLDSVFLWLMGDAYEDLKEYDSAVECFFKSLEIAQDSQVVKIYKSLASSYCFAKDFALALEYSLKAYNLEPKQRGALMTLGRTYLVGHLDIKLARKYLEMALSKGEEAIIYGNLGHLELCEGNTDKAIEYYKRCLIKINDIDEFSRKFDLDVDFMLSYGITEQKYNDIKDMVIDHFKKLAKE